MTVSRSSPIVAPDLGALIGGAARHLAATPPLRCPHLVTNGVVCAQHPAAGILCPDCFVGHAGRHSDELERTCDHCDLMVDGIHPLIVPLGAALTVVTLDGRHEMVYGCLQVAGLGLCAPCAATISQRAKADAS